VGATNLELDRYRKLLNAYVTWTQQFDRKYVEPVQKHVNKCQQRIIPEQNAIILLMLRHEWHITMLFGPGRNLRRGRWFKMAQILTFKINYNQRLPRKSYDVRAFRCSRNGGPPVIWMISSIFRDYYCSKWTVSLRSQSYGMINWTPGWYLQ